MLNTKPKRASTLLFSEWTQMFNTGCRFKSISVV